VLRSTAPQVNLKCRCHHWVGRESNYVASFQNFQFTLGCYYYSVSVLRKSVCENVEYKKLIWMFLCNAGRVWASNFLCYLADIAGIVGTVVAQWLRCCATNWKVAVLIPDGVIGIFHWHNPSDRNMALGSTRPLMEMSTRSISWG